MQLLLQYRKDHLPELDKQARALNSFASRILAMGMVAFGWSYHELETTPSCLALSIRQHTNLQQLAHDMECLTITQRLRYLEVEGGPGSLEDGIQQKRRYSDSDDAVRLAKRARPLQHSEEPDILEMAGLAPMPGEPYILEMAGLAQMPREPEILEMAGLAQMPGELEMSTLLGLSSMSGEQYGSRM